MKKKSGRNGLWFPAAVLFVATSLNVNVALIFLFFFLTIKRLLLTPEKVKREPSSHVRACLTPSQSHVVHSPSVKPDKNQHAVSPPALQNESIINRATGRCLEVVPANVYFGHLLVLQPCSGQRWTIKNTMKQ